MATVVARPYITVNQALALSVHEFNELLITYCMAQLEANYLGDVVEARAMMSTLIRARALSHYTLTHYTEHDTYVASCMQGITRYTITAITEGLAICLLCLCLCGILAPDSME